VVDVGRGAAARRGGLRRSSVLGRLRLARAGQKLDRATAGHLRTYGLNNAQFDVLARVGTAEGIGQKDLGASLVVTKGNVTHLVDIMELRGLLERRPEGRVKRLYLTLEGRELFDQVVPAHEDFVAEIFSALSGE
jgi:DNA-binding MarR family transcriptional regulator